MHCGLGLPERDVCREEGREGTKTKIRPNAEVQTQNSLPTVISVQPVLYTVCIALNTSPFVGIGSFKVLYSIAQLAL